MFPEWRDQGAPAWPEQTDLFLIALDDEPGWYQRHPMCQEALHHEPAQAPRSGGGGPAPHRASAWFADQGMLGEAIRHALAAGETSVAVRLVERHAGC